MAEHATANIPVTVLMPCFNAEKTISLAIESILNQSLTDFEFLITDDGSTDSTWGIVQEYAKRDRRITPKRNKSNLKLSTTLNQGVELARGKYIVRMDADDWSYPDRLEKQLNYMKTNPELVISGGAVEICDENLVPRHKRIYNLNDGEIRKKIFRYSPFCHPAIIMKKDAFISIGGYNPVFEVAQDYELYFRLGKKGKFGNLPNILMKLRLHDSSSFRKNLKLVQRNTFYIRLKAVAEYEYEMNFMDKVYFFLQCLGSFLVPARFVMGLFNFMRNRS